jgi:hypothetical protein
MGLEYPFLIFIFIGISRSLEQLVESEERPGTAVQGEYKYYYSYIGTQKPVDIILQPIYGDTDLYVNITSPDSEVSLMPDRFNHQFASSLSVFVETIRISIADLKPYNLSCLLKVSVLCLSGQCEYKIYYDRGNYLVIPDNRPVQGASNKGGFVYYRYVRTNDKPLMVLLTALGTSNPDLYVARNFPPSKKNATWESSTLGGETLIISEKGLGVYYIGVYCDFKCEFSIILTTDIQPIFPLYSGLPQRLTSKGSSSTNFYFWNPSPEDIEIKVSLITGEIEILANSHNPATHEMYQRVPSARSYTWSSLDNRNEENSLFIPKTDNDFCVDCNIIISVRSLVYSEFTIVANSAQYLEIITNGVPVHGLVYEAQLDSYMFNLDTQSPVEFRLSIYMGDADIYVDTKTPVSYNYYKWQSSTWKTEEILEISDKDKNWVLGTYYIAIYGWKTSSYSLTVITQGSPTLIIPGYKYDYLLKSPLNFYLYLSPMDYICTISSYQVALHPEVYINLNKTFPLLPTDKDHQISYRDPKDYDKVSNTFAFQFKTSEKQIAGISIYPNLNTINSFFGLLCVTSSSVIQLTQHSYNFFTMKSHMLFELRTETEHNTLVTLQSCKGSHMLHVSTEKNPNRTDPNIDSYSERVRKTAQIHKSIGKYYIKVMGNPGTSFELFTELPKTISIEARGIITYSQTDSNFNIFWPKAFINGAESDILLDYYIYTSDTYYEELYSACGLRILEKENKATLEGVYTETRIDIKADKNLYISIVAVFARHAQSSQGYAMYEPIMLEYTHKLNSRFSWIYIVIPITIVLIIIGVFIYKNKRRNQMRNYELSSFARL